MYRMLIKGLYRHPFANRLFRRLDGFLQMADHIEWAYSVAGLNQIIETGTARVAGNWEGDGQSTLIWDYFASILGELKVTSIDLDPRAARIAKDQVTNRVEFIVGDSVEVLSKMSKEKLNKTCLLYLDSYDWSPELQAESSGHHLKELMAVYEHLPGGCLIVVDDCHSPTQGKHTEVKRFFEGLGIPPQFVGYQSGWTKPLIRG